MVNEDKRETVYSFLCGKEYKRRIVVRKLPFRMNKPMVEDDVEPLLTALPGNPKINARGILDWLHISVGLDRKVKDLRCCSKTFQVVARILFACRVNHNAYGNVKDLLDDCGWYGNEVQPLMTTFLYFACDQPRTQVRGIYAEVVKSCRSNDLPRGEEELMKAHQVLAKQAKNGMARKPLLLIIFERLFTKLSATERVTFSERVQEHMKQVNVLKGSKVRKSVRIIVLGDGYDRSLFNAGIDAASALFVPTREALSAYVLAQHNNDVFLLTTNLAGIYEFLVNPLFIPEDVDNFRELYGRVLKDVSDAPAVTRPEETATCSHVMKAKEALRVFIDNHQQQSSFRVKVDVVFAGIGCTRNGLGLHTVLSPHASRFRKVSYYNKESLASHKEEVIRGWLGGGSELVFVKELIPQEAVPNISRRVRWPTGHLPSDQECKTLRKDRVSRTIDTSEFYEPHGPVLRALGNLETEKDNELKRNGLFRRKSRRKIKAPKRLENFA